jgi:hypothetical protein
VFLTGIPEEAFGGGQGIDRLAPGATISGVASDSAPPAAIGFPLGISLQGTFNDNSGGQNLGGGVTCGDCGGAPTSVSAAVTVDIQGVYYIELDSFHADQVRSNGLCCDTDTDYVALTAEQEPSGQQASGTSFGGISVQKGETHGPLDEGPLVLGPYYGLPDGSNVVAFNYSIVNSGHNPGIDILSAMVQAGLQAAGAAAGGGDGATAGDAASGQGLGALLASLTGGFFANCDGPVATYASLPLTGQLLASMTASGPHYETIDSKGTDSASGCGQNSEYHTTWHISRDNS